MAEYNKVQFIAWEVYTGPMHYVEANSIKLELTDSYDYAGINLNNQDRRIDVLSQCVDIDARVAFTRKAIEKAYSIDKVDKSDTTLKLFMAPEFLYRGSGGAYVHDLVNGWKGSSPYNKLSAPYKNEWNGLVGSLRDIVKDVKYKDWLFVFGTVVSASFETRELLNKYWIDITKKAEVYNTAYVMIGGKDGDIADYAVRKHFISDIDFIMNSMSKNKHVHMQETIKPLAGYIKPKNALGENDNSLTFKLEGINNGKGESIKFGIEICKDHLCYKENEDCVIGELKHANEKVDIQLIPSCGMSLNKNSINLASSIEHKFKSYAFNCDGYLDHNLNKIASHVQIENSDIDSTFSFWHDNQFKSTNSSDSTVFEIVEVDKEILLDNYDKNPINDWQLWCCRKTKKIHENLGDNPELYVGGAGNVLITEPKDLPTKVPVVVPNNPAVEPNNP